MPYKDADRGRELKRAKYRTRLGQAWMKNYKEKNAAKISKYLKEWREGNRLKVLSYYSNMNIICASCGYRDIRALCLDHINNDGASHRKTLGNGKRREAGSSTLYLDLIKRGFPEGFQVLCHNCNFIKEQERLATKRKERYGES